jgi:signal transduction histidine kinase
MNKIFEPYFTTKHKFQGTGLGLYMTHKIIQESMKGDISVENHEFIHENKKCIGALFRITLSCNT